MEQLDVTEATVFQEGGRLEFHECSTHAVPDGCRLVMAESSIAGAGWGVFSLEPLKRGQTLGGTSNGDIAIHLTDPNPLAAEGMKRLIWEYLWDGQEVGGQYEGQRVMSFVPGIGMLANGEANLFNVLPLKPSIDNAAISRNSSPGAGAITHYHNLTWKVQRDLEKGSEIFVNYGEGWFKERGYVDQPLPAGRRSSSWLREHGYCLDNLFPGESRLQHAGRGAFASRDLQTGNVIAPVPVLALTSESLKMAKEHEATGQVVITEQLARNYCFGHRNSSRLLFPYSPMVNLINHGSEGTSNVKLRWSEASVLLIQVNELQELTSRLLLELVATRPIDQGDEILLDYGAEWESAWKDHVEHWQPPRARYVSSHDMNRDEEHRILLTPAELQIDPYPDNIFTSCYYRLSVELNLANTDNPSQVLQWRKSPGLMEGPRYLRPCAVLDRHPVGKDRQGEFLYTVRIFNRPGLDPSERVPKGRPYILKGVPRYAIEFSDKLYTTDLHLENSFRKEITLDVFPNQWMDINW